jgi:excinuclease UvrABC ATPase subunit
MAKYVAILRQDDKAKTVQFDTENAIDASKILKKLIFENHDSDETRLSSVIYYEIADKYEVDIKRWYAEFEKEKKNDILKKEYERIKQKDIAEYERIKQKYNL